MHLDQPDINGYISEQSVYMLRKSIATCIESLYMFECWVYTFVWSVKMYKSCSWASETRREMLSSLVGMIRGLFLG